MSGPLKPAYVPIVELRDPRTKVASRYYFATERGENSMDCGRALATRDRAKALQLVEAHPGGRVLEWALSDRRINW